MVSDEGFERDVFQRQFGLLSQRVALGQNQHMLPLVAGQGDQLSIGCQGFGGNANLGHLIEQHARHLLWRALVQADIHFGVGLTQPCHRLGQHIPGLGVCGGD